MTVTLIRDTRISYKTGETIEVSPELYKVLVETGSAEPEKEKTAPKKAATKKK